MYASFLETCNQLVPKEQRGSFQHIRAIQRLLATHFPFENLDVLRNEIGPITKKFLIDKFLVRRRGGLCYEINAFMYIILKDLHIPVTLAIGTTQSDGTWNVPHTHAIMMWKKDENLYVIDNGTGNNLALAPLQLDGPSVTSPSGLYRLKTEKTEQGTIVMEKQEEEQWTTLYAFHPVTVPWGELDEIKTRIHTHERSSFRTKLIITQTLSNGTISINNERVKRKWIDGQQTVVPFQTNQQLVDTIYMHFPPSIADVASNYFL